MADTYPRVFIPNRNFSTVAGVLTSTPTGGTLETVDGEPPSVKENLADFDPLLRWYTSGADTGKAYSWQFTHTASVDQTVDAVAFLDFFLQAQTVDFSLRNASGTELEEISLVLAASTGPPRLSVAEASQQRAIRSLRYTLTQAASQRSVVGFVLPGLVQELSRAPFQVVEQTQNLPRVIDPYQEPVEQGEYSRFGFSLREASQQDVSRIRQWAAAGVLIVELSRGDWQIGSFDIRSVQQFGERRDVDFFFTEQLI